MTDEDRKRYGAEIQAVIDGTAHAQQLHAGWLDAIRDRNDAIRALYARITAAEGKPPPPRRLVKLTGINDSTLRNTVRELGERARR